MLKTIKKIKKQIVNRKILKKNISHINIFFKKNFENFPEIVSKISNASNKIPQQIR